MAKKKNDIDHILQHWSFDPTSVNVRILELTNREVLQMRVDMGVLQLEIEGRPDGGRPDGAPTYFELLKQKASLSDQEFVLSETQCIEVDREFVQFYHRRICWLQLKEFDRAVRDADHTLALMDFCKVHSPDDEWTISHEQYRPFVLYHRTQAAALTQLEVENSDRAELAIDEVNQGLNRLRFLFLEYNAEEQFANDELVQRLTEFRDSLREKYGVEQTLHEQLASAVENEEYEWAADLRDQISQRDEASHFEEE
ncbi:MAG: UvrB/UvrC motif-containing protein [Mariniblastus sp.]|nr:UvrB/UvrC motif-containing protein [Mariniblastus sp.]